MVKPLANELDNINNQELVIRAIRGDQQSFRLLYRHYHSRVRSTLYQLCGSYLLDDLVQEVFLKAWKNLPKLRQPAYFSTWLYRITWNVANDYRRKLAITRENQKKNYDLPQEMDTNPKLMELHYQDLIQKGLQTLSFNHRAVLILHDLEDLPQGEVASILNIRVGTVKSRLFYARQEMRKFLQQQGVEL